VYRRYDIDGSTGQATPTNILDSCYISKDTLIHGKTYYKLVRPSVAGFLYERLYLRDSLHYLVDHRGRRFFSSEDASTVLRQQYVVENISSIGLDTICLIKTQMEGPTVPVTTPAGSYTAKVFRQTYQIYPRWRGTNPAIREIKTLYAENVGIVSETLPFFIGSPNYSQRRLLRYRVR
jgi:hypothetical protein